MNLTWAKNNCRICSAFFLPFLVEAGRLYSFIMSPTLLPVILLTTDTFSSPVNFMGSNMVGSTLGLLPLRLSLALKKKNISCWIKFQKSGNNFCKLLFFKGFNFLCFNKTFTENEFISIIDTSDSSSSSKYNSGGLSTM